MEKTENKRKAIQEILADHLLAQGMNGASLRTLATAAGISDRMLLHYFANKEELLTGTLLLIAERLTALLDKTRSARKPFEAFLPHLAGMIRQKEIRPYLKLWLELVALSAGGEEMFRGIAQTIRDGFFDWIASGLKVEQERDLKPLASLAFATIEGFVLLDALDSPRLIDSALKGFSSLLGEKQRPRLSRKRTP